MQTATMTQLTFTTKETKSSFKEEKLQGIKTDHQLLLHNESTVLTKADSTKDKLKTYRKNLQQLVRAHRVAKALSQRLD